LSNNQERLVSDLTLFVSPRACSLACHIALEESGLPYEARIVRIRKGEHKTDDYLKINSWGKVPALRVDDEVLTEVHAILGLIGDTARAEKNLMPRDNPLLRARAHEWMNFLSATVHIAFRPLFRPNLFVEDEKLYTNLHAVAIPNLRKTLLEVDRRIGDRTWALGEQYSVCDAYLLVFYIWSQREDVVSHVADMPNWRALAERVFAREATWICLRREGVTPENIFDV